MSAPVSTKNLAIQSLLRNKAQYHRHTPSAYLIRLIKTEFNVIYFLI